MPQLEKNPSLFPSQGWKNCFFFFSKFSSSHQYLLFFSLFLRIGTNPPNSGSGNENFDVGNCLSTSSSRGTDAPSGRARWARWPPPPLLRGSTKLPNWGKDWKKVGCTGLGLSATGNLVGEATEVDAATWICWGCLNKVFWNIRFIKDKVWGNKTRHVQKLAND